MFELNKELIKELDDNTSKLIYEIKKSFEVKNYLLGILGFRIFVLHIAGHLGMKDPESFKKSLNYIEKSGFSWPSENNENGNEILKILIKEINSINHDWNFDYNEISNFENAKIYWSWVNPLLSFLFVKYNR
ncbi:MAG: hypothetical protein HPAVJP_5820 [Candidatus Hepatoplasma vulgare]|nr:MAG: hypothetical protein HPAVJP_5820 [Candidatus Hepatoplasma sp.]